MSARCGAGRRRPRGTPRADTATFPPRAATAARVTRRTSPVTRHPRKGHPHAPLPVPYPVPPHAAPTRPGGTAHVGTSQDTVTLGGHTWTVHKGNNGANEVLSFLRTSDSSSGTVNILPILKWIKDTKGWRGNETIGDVQFGYEITSSSGGLDFTTDNLTVNSS
ncbi:hypothetical protein GCM10010358_58990 [Streptomyces minutiscleroticus]|uniref:Uncharacterized protein n=1 Tax=Streptomyces minutiscleroticus TaxID=68238 RepID=A0A918U6D4_9ACTN|nr:hypothetical protein GCM10010358_58990 [Streptomyces minutiscleroticus]